MNTKYFQLPFSTVGGAIGFTAAVVAAVIVVRMLPLPKALKV